MAAVNLIFAAQRNFTKICSTKEFHMKDAHKKFHAAQRNLENFEIYEKSFHNALRVCLIILISKNVFPELGFIYLFSVWGK